MGKLELLLLSSLDHPNNVKEIEELSTQKLQKVDNNIKNLFDKTNPIRLTPFEQKTQFFLSSIKIMLIVVPYTCYYLFLY